MPRTRFVHRAVACLALMAACGVVRAQESKPTLKVGDPAPALAVGKWVQGEPVKTFEKGTVYVLEYWATWCGPCVRAIPHVNELQKKYDGKVVVIGMNVWENNEAAVEPFVKKMGEKMTYRVAMDDKTTHTDGAMAKTWMEAAGQNGIPCSFIIDKDGKIAWIGHPEEMDKPLEQIVAGTFDPKAAAAEGEKVKNLQKELSVAMRAGDTDKVMKLLDEAADSIPTLKAQLPLVKFDILMSSKKFDQAYGLGDAVYDTIKDDAQQLNRVAWSVATDEGITQRDLKLAKRFAERAVEVSERKEAAILDTLARVMFDSGEIDKAIEVQTEAVSKSDDQGKAELEQALKKYKAAKK